MPARTTARTAAPDTASAAPDTASAAPIPSDWRSVDALVEKLNAGLRKPTFSPHAIRHYVRHAESNGLAPHIRRIGRKILISEAGFMAWLNGFGQTQAA